MSAVGQVFVQDATGVRKLLSDAGAKRVKGNGTAATYVSHARNLTFNLFDAGPGRIKVQVLSGCVC